MYRTLRSIVVELACQLPDWIFLTAGIAICAAALLVPAYLENRQLLWQQGLQAKQYQTMQQQEQDYRGTLRALDANDPVLLERLAYPYLHLKPVGATPMLVGGHGAPADRFAAVDVWLQRPLPRGCVDYPAYTPIESPGLRFVTGAMRVPALAVGAFMIFLSVLPVARSRGVRAMPPVIVPASAGPASPPLSVGAPAEAVVASGGSCEAPIPRGFADSTPGLAVAAGSGDTSSPPAPLPTADTPGQLSFDGLDNSASA